MRPAVRAVRFVRFLMFPIGRIALNKRLPKPSGSGGGSDPLAQAAESPLLKHLREHGVPERGDREWRRSETRYVAQELTRLELRRANGEVYKARLHNVSQGGVCVICPQKVDLFESLLVRLLGDSGPYERFKVVHASSTVGAFKIGMIPDTD